jgi:hypothetical protein
MNETDIIFLGIFLVLLLGVLIGYIEWGNQVRIENQTIDHYIPANCTSEIQFQQMSDRSSCDIEKDMLNKRISEYQEQLSEPDWRKEVETVNKYHNYTYGKYICEDFAKDIGERLRQDGYDVEICRGYMMDGCMDFDGTTLKWNRCYHAWNKLKVDNQTWIISNGVIMTLKEGERLEELICEPIR